MPYCVRLLLGIYSPSCLAIGDPNQLALVWFVHRLRRRFKVYRWLFGATDPGMLAHYWLHLQVRPYRNGPPAYAYGPRSRRS